MKKSNYYKFDNNEKKRRHEVIDIILKLLTKNKDLSIPMIAKKIGLNKGSTKYLIRYMNHYSIIESKRKNRWTVYNLPSRPAIEKILRPEFANILKIAKNTHGRIYRLDEFKASNVKLKTYHTGVSHDGVYKLAGL